MQRIRNAIARWLHTGDTPQWNRLGLPDDWQSITFRADKVSEEFSVEVLHAAPFTTHFLAPAISARRNHEQGALQWLGGEQSVKGGVEAIEDTERSSREPYWQHVVFDRSAIDSLYQRSAGGNSVAGEQIKLFEAIVTSHLDEKVIFCGERRHVK